MTNEGLKQISAKMSEDQSYAQNIVSDYKFAQAVFEKANMKLSHGTHQQLSTAFNSLQASTNNAFGKLANKAEAGRAVVIDL